MFGGEKEETVADHVATAEVQIDGTSEEVWNALTDPGRRRESARMIK